ncbi:hypothetical protein MESS2_860013 [Mesorhizobium metallidurans STM 2683]|uniref:Uncharacterized protein n=1 Tax=Mesorhizobium metallidurans STM 2683 TaxID=1297569 RepID=M5EYU5_9HYPH|nr:hypothetical protein MESS2_860013 [Mesorhizobium metallidurans STM 2683]
MTQGLFLRIELLAEGAMQLDIAIDVVVDHDAAPGQD